MVRLQDILLKRIVEQDFRITRFMVLLVIMIFGLIRVHTIAMHKEHGLPMQSLDMQIQQEDFKTPPVGLGMETKPLGWRGDMPKTVPLDAHI